VLFDQDAAAALLSTDVQLQQSAGLVSSNPSFHRDATVRDRLTSPGRAKLAAKQLARRRRVLPPAFTGLLSMFCGNSNEADWLVGTEGILKRALRHHRLTLRRAEPERSTG
jgi:hypothetical protein